MSGIPSPSLPRLNGGDRDKDSMWYFTSEELANSPSRKAGISPDQELSYRQMTAYLIQEMGQRLQVSQLCINTAIVYMHRFYAFHSFTHFHRNGIAAASLFLAAKVEEQPRKLEHVIKAANKCLSQPTTSTTDTLYLEQAQDLVFNENVLLQTLGFDVAIDHPHTHVVKTCQLVKACKDLAQTSYFLASNSLHLTSMCLQYKPSVVACFCIYLACKWSRWEIPQSTEGKHWFHYVDETVTMELLKKLTDEFIAIYEKSPARLKSKLNSIKAMAQGASNRQGQVKDKKADQDWKVSDMMNMKMYHPAETGVNSSSQSQSSSSQYSSQGSVGNEQLSQQQPGGNITQPMLPPPPHQSQQMRKPDIHSSSQHRSHHSSSSSSSHHPPKIGYSPGDVPDHKLNTGHSKQQQPQQQPPQPYGGNSLVPNRPPREHSSTSMMAPSNNKSSSSSSSSRTSMSNSLPGPPMRQSSSQGHPMEINYHKSRERSITVPPPPAHNIPPHGMPHKLAQKQDGNRSMSSKDHSGRLVSDQANKQNNGSNSSSNKMFPSSVPSQYGSNSLQIPSGSSSGNQLPTKLDTMHDITRNLMHTSRSSYSNAPPPPPTNGLPGSLLNFHPQQQQGPRNSNNSNNTSSSSLKHEQSKQQLSVHMQQQSQSAAHHHKQPQPSMPTDQTYSGLNVTHELQQPPHVGSSLISNNFNKIEPMQHSEEHPHPVNQYNSQPAQNQAVKSVNSLFSPEWNDKHQGQQESQMQQVPSLPQSLQGSGMNSYINNATGNLIQNPEAYAGGGYKMPSNTISNKESPPKIKTERDTPSKKDKNRSNISNQDNGRSATGHVPQQMLKTTIPKKLDTSISSGLTGLNELAGTSIMGMVGSGGIKRPNEPITIKQEDDGIARDSKIRKLDTPADISKHQVVNGIETNPDLVRNLLKESLCSTSGLLKTEPSIVTPSLQPPAELFEPSASTSSSTNQHNTSITSISTNNVLSSNSDVSAMETDEHGTSGSKSEKKKKKDKHKHKEKDKSKDREERKKHKKDKDRHKDKDKERDRDNDNGNAGAGAEHVKIKISKEKLEATGEPIGFKIKIPKDRIMGDLNSSSSSQSHIDTAPPPHAPPVLKIKISKDKLESYGTTDLSTGTSATTHPLYAHNQSTAYTSYGAGSHSGLTTTTTHTSNSSSSSKKKDRDREKDRERDKEKKRSHDSLSSKSNSSAGVLGGGSSNLMTATASLVGSNATNGLIAGQNHSNSNSSGSSTTQKPQYSSKIHHQSSMSLLFGESNESNDDDDDYFF